MDDVKNKPYKIVVADPLYENGWDLLDAAQDIEVLGPHECGGDIRPFLVDADALLVCSDTTVDAELLAGAPELKAVARAGARLDNVDIDEATRKGIFVIHVPEANVLAVVEYTFFLMLALARRFTQEGSQLQSEAGDLGFQLAGRSLGIIGFGRQGRAIAARALAFGMHVLAYDPYIDLSFARERGVEIIDLPELLSRADIITLHTAYTPLTHHLLNKSAFDQMKPGSYLVNCVHSELVDKGQLLDALKSGQLAGVAFDTIDEGDCTDFHHLLDHYNILITCSRGQTTVEAQATTAEDVVRDLLGVLRGENYRHVVNLPFTKEAPYHLVRPYMDLAVKLGKLQGQLAEGWITRVEVELLGDDLGKLVRPVAAVLLSGMVRPVDERPVNWVSAPVLADEQGIITAQTKGLAQQDDYPALLACRVFWEGGQRTVSGALFGNGEVRLVGYDDFKVDAFPSGYVLVLENEDRPGVIGKVGTRLSQENISIAQWRYGREYIGGKGISFINLDHHVPQAILEELETEPEIKRARLVRL